MGVDVGNFLVSCLSKFQVKRTSNISCIINACHYSTMVSHRKQHLQVLWLVSYVTACTCSMQVPYFFFSFKKKGSLRVWISSWRNRLQNNLRYQLEFRIGCLKAGSAFDIQTLTDSYFQSGRGKDREWEKMVRLHVKVMMSFLFGYFLSRMAVFKQNTSTLMSAIDVMTESPQSAARHQNPSALVPMHRNEVIRTVSEGNPCCVLQPCVAHFYL